MTKLNALVLAALLASPMTTRAATELFISEYGEGSSHNKFIELYNGTAEPVDLMDYQLWIARNGTNAWADSTVDLVGTLEVGDVYVICHSSAAAAIKTHADAENGLLNFNGDDAVGLAKTNAVSGWVLIDSVGQELDDPDVGWDVAGTNNATFDHTLVRTASEPTTHWPTSAGTGPGNSGWDVYPKDTFTFIGYHGVAPQQPPFIFHAPPQTSHTLLVQSPLEFRVIADDFNGDTITLTPGSLPTGAVCSPVTGTPPVTNTFTWTPETGGDYDVVFTATDKDGVTTSTVSMHVSTVLPSPEKLWINELHYDNSGVDTNEGVEVAGRTGTDLSSFVLYPYNGSTKLVLPGSVLALSGTIPNQQDRFGTQWFPIKGLQNDMEGVALVYETVASTQVIQFLSYEGSFAALDGPAKGLVSEDIGVEESNGTPVDHSLQIIGRGNVYTDFSWVDPMENTGGAVNAGQSFVANPTLLIIH